MGIYGDVVDGVLHMWFWVLCLDLGEILFEGGYIVDVMNYCYLGDFCFVVDFGLKGS